MSTLKEPMDWIELTINGPFTFERYAFFTRPVILGNDGGLVAVHPDARAFAQPSLDEGCRTGVVVIRIPWSKYMDRYPEQLWTSLSLLRTKLYSLLTNPEATQIEWLLRGVSGDADLTRRRHAFLEDLVEGLYRKNSTFSCSKAVTLVFPEIETLVLPDEQSGTLFHLEAA